MTANRHIERYEFQHDSMYSAVEGEYVKWEDYGGLLEQANAMQRELELWSVGLGPGPERMKELRAAQRGR